MAKQAAQLPNSKIALLHVAKRDLGLTDDDYRAILLRLANVASSRDLDLPGFKSSWQKRTFGHRRDMASPAQVDLIRRLWRGYHGSDDDAALNAWLNHFHHIAALRFVDTERAQPVIAALKAMVARKRNGH